MSKHRGVPLYRAAQDCFVFVTVEIPGEPPMIRRWKGRSAKSIRAAAKEFYPKSARLQFGRSFYVTR